MKIKVKPEGREGVWVVEWEAEINSLIDFIRAYPSKEIHNFIPNGSLMLGADWSKKSVIDEIKKAERVAILTGDSRRHNMNHALSVISNNELYIFDIGKITESDLEVCNDSK